LKLFYLVGTEKVFLDNNRVNNIEILKAKLLESNLKQRNAQAFLIPLSEFFEFKEETGAYTLRS